MHTVAVPVTSVPMLRCKTLLAGNSCITYNVSGRRTKGIQRLRYVPRSACSYTPMLLCSADSDSWSRWEEDVTLQSAGEL